MMRSSPTSWGWMARSLHWSMAVLIAGQIVLGKYAHELERSPEKLNLMMWHKSLGVCLIFLFVLRVLWRFVDQRPLPAQPGVPWERTAARLNHLALYALMLLIPISGWLMNSAKNIPFSLFRLVPWPSLMEPNEALGKLFGEWHENLVTVLLVLVAIHVAAALLHHFHRRENVLRRMLGLRAEP